MKKYTVLLLTLIMSSSLLGCTQQSNTANNTPTDNSATTQQQTETTTTASTDKTEPSSQASPTTAQQGTTATAEQVKAATEVAKQYKQAEYDVPDYKQLNMDDSSATDKSGLPAIYQQQYEHLQSYTTANFLKQQITNRLLVLPQHLAVQSKANLKADDLQLTPDPVFKVKGIMEIDYQMNIAVGDKEKIPLTGTLQLQQNEGEWKVINDAYNKTQLAKLLDRAAGRATSSS